MKIRYTIISFLMFLSAVMAQAQIKIGGNVYGGGNEGVTSGNTTVTVRAGDFMGGVYGGARQANVVGHAFVNIDGAHMSDNIVINAVYGGNDIAGTVGSSAKLPFKTVTTTDAQTGAEITTEEPFLTETTANGIDNTYNAFILTTPENATDKHIFIGQLYGGGNGDYDYEHEYANLQQPELSKTYLEIKGGTIACLFGGGNNATVTSKTDICINNTSAVTTNAHLPSILTDTRLQSMGLNTVQTHAGSADYHFGRVFGGNNKADMSILPTWHLEKGGIRDLYSGGNEGRMISPVGVLLEIPETSAIEVNNVYGGCRKADVRPLDDNKQDVIVRNSAFNDYLGITDPTKKYQFPDTLSARVIIRGGTINNVYGGNDISGKVHGGNAIGIYASVNGDVYGGGNGSYPYTNKSEFKTNLIYSDYYYEGTTVADLNAFRPNAESVSIRVTGKKVDGKIVHTVVGGAIYCGGNSATLRNDKENVNPKAQLKIGSYVIADKVFLGNNGANMVTEEMLRTLKDVNSLDLTDETVFAGYMDGCAMMIEPEVVFDNVGVYEPYSTWFGSFYCGGNVGSMKIDRALNISFNDKIVIFDKVVGGSNEANVYALDGVNAQYLGGLLGSTDTNGNKLILNFGGLRIQPKRWKIKRDKEYKPILDGDGHEQYDLDDDGNRQLEWNTVDSRTFNPQTKKYSPMESVTSPKDFEERDLYRRFQGGNVYGGCYNNGHVEGNVVINLNASLVDRKGDNAIFDEVEEEEGEAKLYDENYNITKRNTGVLIGQQGMDPLGRALNVFGGGYGGDSEIWGSTTINLNAGYTFQIFGGGEQGAIGRAASNNGQTLNYEYNEKYSTCINLKDKEGRPGTFREDKDNSGDGAVDYPDLAECEFIYGGGFEGLIAGNTRINLGNGRIFNSFAGSCNADILGHTETYVGRNTSNDNDLGFPWIRDHIYGGNDLGGRILNVGKQSFKNRVSSDLLTSVYGYKASTGENDPGNTDPKVLQASAYTEYIQGRVEHIFAGCYGDYDYTDPHYSAYTYTRSLNADGETYTYAEGSSESNVGTCKLGFHKPWMDNAFVNFKPINNERSQVKRIYGAGQGHAFLHTSDGERNSMQDRSYVLIDAPDNLSYFQNTEVFGAGDYSGVGMRNEEATTMTVNGKTVEVIPALSPVIARTNADGVTASTIIDLMRGKLRDVYGASYQEGITRRTIVNVPAGSTIYLNRIFGGAYGLRNDKPCDVIESNVNYNSALATMHGYWIEEDIDKDGNLKSGGIYGGNNSARRTLYTRLNINSRVMQDVERGYEAKVFGAGYGSDTWAQYTRVDLNSGASVYEAYGGGYGGMVLNKQSVDAWEGIFKTLGAYTDEGLNSYLVNENPLGFKTNTNVYVYKNTNITGYCYGGGLGADAVVSGTTYVGLHGGRVNKDIYGAGWGGPVYDKFRVAKDGNADNDFVATTNVFIEGGEVRNVYGGGYQGPVGYHNTSTTAITDDILGVSNVVIGIRKDQVNLAQIAAPYDSLNYYKGVPVIERNAYGAGEGGAVYGTANLTINNGYIGYYYDGIKQMTVTVKENDVEVTKTIDYEAYEPKLDDETWSVESERAGRLKDCGNVFGGGYDDQSTVDFTNVTMWGGKVRSSMYGGGEIATVGRGKTHNITGLDRDLEYIYKAGKTHITMYNGHVMRNVFGGGKGYNILGYGGTHELYTDGYVFGQTEVYIHGGEIGTVEGVVVKEDGTGGYGNVFGGGDIGYVYSKGYFNAKTIADKNITTGSPGHHYFYSDYKCNADYGNYKKNDVIDQITYNAMSTADKAHWNSGSFLTEDCKVVISPYLQVKDPAGAEFNNHPYAQYDYVETDDLNTLPKKNKVTKLYDGGWEKLFTGDKDADGNTIADDPVERGVMIHNAVFAGGNVSSNSDKTYANATTVFGNSTATLYDVYHRDFITVGTEHIGGLYGGGNLSVVEGYRELNITNYGTDYYGQDDQISLEDYRKLSNRERAYFKLQYVCMTEFKNTKNNKTYKVNDKIDEDEYKNIIDDGFKTDTYWQQYGFCSIYAGRLLNTIQRADLCGVFGSRMVLQGAKDRVASVGSASEYTINRVGEVSLNQQRDVNATNNDLYDYKNDMLHGNYFGIYNVVNYLGHLTSDIKFIDPLYKVESDEVVKDDSNTYYSWKTSRLQKRDRNNGTAFNQVALASGVFLELTTEMSTQSKKVYGDITGIVELDLINVKKDIEGGGYVYARNEHGEPSYDPDVQNVILSEYNEAKAGIRDELCTYKHYSYDQDIIRDYQTSGNFIHKRKRIVDDCYPKNGIYDDGYVESPAHYWYIKGEVYIYDQVVSAYAGSASAYSKEVKIPLTITAASNGRLTLLNVQPNLYAYYADYTQSESKKIPTEGVKIDNERTTVKLNDVITWWDWNQLTDTEQKLFVKETYVNVDTCYIDNVPYPAGTYVLENDPSLHNSGEQTAYEIFRAECLAGNHVIQDQKKTTDVTVDNMFHSSNNISHETGYVLTYGMDSPSDWDVYYSPVTGDSRTGKIKNSEYNNEGGYLAGPTYYLNGESGLYGQHHYDVNDIITKEIRDDYENTVRNMSSQPTGQATVDEAYVAISDYPVNGTTVLEGNPIPKSVYDDLSAEAKTHFDRAFTCLNTIQLGDEEFILSGDLVAESKITEVAGKYKAFNNRQDNTDEVDDTQAHAYVMNCLSEAYICTSEGNYGGQYYVGGTNYSALKSWSTLSDDRTNFKFNYDALDLLVESSFPGEDYTYKYDGLASSNADGKLYSATKPVEYVAAYTKEGTHTYYFTDDPSHTPHTITKNDAPLSREDFERVLNEQIHYTRFLLEDVGDNTVYIVKENFIHSGTPYAKGQDISMKDYLSLGSDQTKVDILTIHNTGAAKTAVYYCYDGYADERGKRTGDVIDKSTFDGLENYQQGFTVQGKEPTETTTLYVSRESNARDVTSDKIITVVYQYTYYESDDDGDGVSLNNELHVLNIHLHLESGAPAIGPLNAPPTVLPGAKVGLKPPTVNPGLYEILTNGWMMYQNEEDAIHHRNGKPFYNNKTQLYWYQNEKTWVNFYSKTYLGYTYSNPVPISVANYHDMDDVMADKANHMYVDHPDVMRDSKIYIDNRDCKADETKSELDLLKDFFDLSLITKSTTGITTDGDSITNADHKLKGHKLLNSRVRGGKHLEFFLNSNVSPKKYTEWTPIGNDNVSDNPNTPDIDEGANGQCFEGTLHGDGYTISGLDHSLFGHLCGNVYNLGVTGSFTSAGIADEGDGYIENSWVKSTKKTMDSGVKAIFGTPGDESRKQVVNCYYWDQNAYAQGDAHAMTDREFYNGTVAYNLNGFYLNKRYYDGIQQTSGKEYHYFKTDAAGELTDLTSHYPTDANASNGSLGYVEKRYEDGDFRYAGGTVPQTSDKRERLVAVEKTENGQTVIETKVEFAPVWPDDYLFFGQLLTYGYDVSYPHEDTPSRIVKQGGSIPLSRQSNRVYRAPAYFRSKDLDVAHFNPQAYLTAYSAPKSAADTDLNPAYPNMTAIDFNGHKEGHAAGAYKLGYNGKLFYQPLLDDDGLIGISTNGETPNLLVYAPAAAAANTGGYANEKTNGVLTGGYFDEPEYADYHESTNHYTDGNDNYNRVYQAPSNINGHLVLSTLTTSGDHLLVDKKDFNSPIAYSMGAGQRMWYQRTPDNFVDRTGGWEAVSLPFEAEMVTTNVKGELTHFYKGSTTSHEYWLREFAGNMQKKKDKNGNDVDGVYTADFDLLAKGTNEKNYANTFLWDYYYSKDEYKDQNTDQYQKQYYSADYLNELYRNVADYPYSQPGVPYLIGFPGSTYYEFDLSGLWTPEHRYLQHTIASPGKQTLTFVSKAGIGIGVSDDEMGGEAAGTAYTFKPTYLNNPEIASAMTVYQLDDDGDSFDKTAAGAVDITAFRPYFISASNGSRTRNVEQIEFSQSDSKIGQDEKGNPKKGETGYLYSYPKRKKIVVESALTYTTEVRIVNTAGITIATFDIEPGEVVETRIYNAGIYIVQSSDGRYIKKLAVR